MENSIREDNSEFGCGYSYCLGLFLAHADRIEKELEVYKKIGDENRAYSMWFYAAADHIFEFQTDDDRSKAFKERVMSLRLPMGISPEATEEDFKWAISEAKALLLEYDKRNGIHAVKGSWE